MKLPSQLRWTTLPAALLAIAGCAARNDSNQAAASGHATTPAPAAASAPTTRPASSASTATTARPASAPSTAAATKPPGDGKSGYAVIKDKKEPAPVIPMGDPAAVARIIDEGKNRNHVMDHITYLCNEIGPRLTGSTNQEKCAKWAKGQFESFGLKADLWQWGEIPVRFDRGPSVGRVVSARPGSDELRTARELEFTTAA